MRGRAARRCRWSVGNAAVGRDPTADLFSQGSIRPRAAGLTGSMARDRARPARSPTPCSTARPPPRPGSACPAGHVAGARWPSVSKPTPLSRTDICDLAVGLAPASTSHMLGLGVLGDVGQRLLHQPVHREFGRWSSSRHRLQRGVDLQLGALGELARQDLQRGDQAQVAQRRRTQVLDDAALERDALLSVSSGGSGARRPRAPSRPSRDLMRARPAWPRSAARRARRAARAPGGCARLRARSAGGCASSVSSAVRRATSRSSRSRSACMRGCCSSRCALQAAVWRRYMNSASRLSAVIAVTPMRLSSSVS